MTSIDQELPEHVRRIIDRDGAMDFTPPSFERWLGRLVMLRTIASMLGFSVVWLLTVDAGYGWEAATIRGIIASIVFYFFAWAAGLFVFGELYDGEVKRARAELEAKERERAQRIEDYYRERLRAQEQGQSGHGYPPVTAPEPGDDLAAAAAITQNLRAVA